MAESIVSDIVSRLVEYLGKSVAEEVASYFGGRGKLNELKRTMKMIQARLLDAERRGEGEDGALVKEWLKGLKQLLYRLEDLFQEVAMADKENEQMARGKLIKSLNVTFSRSRPSKLNKKVAREAKSIMEELKAITFDMFSLNLKAHSIGEQPVADLINCKTHSFVLENRVIGRDDDKRAIVEQILYSDVGQSVSVLPIIGIGGLGKTTLAQLIFNDILVQQHFELKCWACISKISSLEGTMREVFKSLTLDDCEQLSMEQLQSCIRGVFNDKKYLLVLDDIWDENRERWLGLRDLLSGGKHGSRIIVTTRSRVVADNMGTVVHYELGGLPEDKSWELFRTLAFKEGQEDRNPNLINVGKEIIKKCANVPLAIRTIAALLHSKDTMEEWEYVKDSELRLMEHKEDSIMSTLKLSYNQLPSHLKQCFAYCSLFPRDWILDKQELTYLWMAQGLLVPVSGTGQCPEDIGHVCFMELLRSSFFREVLRDEHGDIIGGKMHDLMHDLAQMVAGEECQVVHGSIVHNSDYIRYVRFFVNSSWKAPSWLLAAKQLRSLHLQMTNCTTDKFLDDIFSSLKCLRILDLELINPPTNPQIPKTLPNSIGKLKLLRYVRLAVSSESLPECITELQILQTLDLWGCHNLRKLPRGFNKLTSLRHLHLSSPVNLIDMPLHFSQLTSLQALDVFIVGGNNRFDTLASLSNLAGKLEVLFVKRHGEALSQETPDIFKKMKLTSLVLRWFWAPWHHGATVFADMAEDDLIMKCTQPPSSLRTLEVYDWNGLRFPCWRMDLLPNLVSVEICCCELCRTLPPLGKLPQLKYLKLFSLHSLEYIEIGGNISEASSAAAHFSLPQPLFPRLSKLHIGRCSNLMSVPQVPILESLILRELNGRLPKNLGCLTTLRELVMYKLPYLEAQPKWIGNLTQLRRLAIEDCPKLTELPLFPSPLQQLVIRDCGSLKGISSALQHLSFLEELEIECCEELELWDSKDDDDVSSICSSSTETNCSSSSSKSSYSGSSFTSGAWQGLKNLRSLKLVDIQKLESLPRDLACLTTLQKLCIRLPNLRALPEWVVLLTQLHELFVGPELTMLPQSLRNLTSLQKLTIWNCPELHRRYQHPDDEYWSLVHHIPHFKIC